MARYHLSIWAVVALLPIAVFGMGAGAFLYQQVFQTATLRLQEITASCMSELDQELRELAGALAAVAAMPGIGPGMDSARVGQLHALMGRYPHWREILVARPSGEVAARVARDAGAGFAGAAAAAGAEGGVLPVTPQGGAPAIVHVPAADGRRSHILVAVRAGNGDGGGPIVAGRVAVAAVKSVMSRSGLPPGASLSLWDPALRPIVRRGTHLKLGPEGTLEARIAAGFDLGDTPLHTDLPSAGAALEAVPDAAYVALSRSPTTGWLLTLAVPESEALAGGRRAFLVILISGVAALLASSGIAFQLFRLIRRSDRAGMEVAQKELLLRETNHRVKNSLQMIASIIRLQRMKAADPAVKDQLGEAGRRISVIARVHDRLYRDDLPERVAAEAFLEALCRDIRDTAGGRLHFGSDAGSLRVTADAAVTLALITSELVTNAFKYGAAAGAAAEVRIDLSCADGRLRLCVGDDGPGLPSDFDPQAQPGLGLKLVDSLVQHLDGTLVIGAGDESLICVEIPLSAVVAD